MRPRRLVGILERRLLGAAVSFVLSIAERRLSRRSVVTARDAPGRGMKSVKSPSPDDANGP
jgi:hypothetical protein